MVIFNKSSIVQNILGTKKKLEAWRITIIFFLVYSEGENYISMETKALIGENKKINLGTDDYRFEKLLHRLQKLRHWLGDIVIMGSTLYILILRY